MVTHKMMLRLSPRIYKMLRDLAGKYEVSMSDMIRLLIQKASEGGVFDKD